MVDDPYTYDLSEFAIQFTWSLLFWNQAEDHAKWMLSGILGGHTAMHAVVADVGSRSLTEALRSAAWGMEEHPLRQHVEHFSKGFERLCQYRNLYVHGLQALDFGEPSDKNVRPLSGRIMSVREKGRLRAINQPLPTSEVAEFKNHVQKLHEYGRAISRELGFDDDTFQEMLGTLAPSLEMPVWPAPPKNSIHYIQD